MANHLVLSVAGGRKTQGIVDYCATLVVDRRVLILTFTQTNQTELLARIRKAAGNALSLEVMGWYTFLIRHFARPFLPFKFRGKRVRGFNFEGRPFRLARGQGRFLDRSDALYACELARLSKELMDDSNGSLLKRLQCLFDEIIIDEVQDLSAHDWEILEVLLRSTISVSMVGDVRQAILSTNPRSQKNRAYAYADSLKWFRKQERQGLLSIEERSVTWRCRPEIAHFSDSIFPAECGFPRTQSENKRETAHDGVFLIAPEHVSDYVSRFEPLCLKHSVTSGRSVPGRFLNFGQAKGMTTKRTLIAPTAGIEAFLQSGRHLEARAAASFYVAVTRAEQSVAIVLARPKKCVLPYWRP